MFHLKLKDTLKHSIANVTSHMDSFVYNPGRDAIILVYENFLQIMLFRSLFLKALHPRNANFWISFKCQRISLLYLP